MPVIAFIGMGEAGRAFVSGWGDRPDLRIRAFDIKTDARATEGDQWALYDEMGITGCGSAAEAIIGADMVFCTVTADQATAAARSGAAHLGQGAWWFDLNSCAPASKQTSEAAIRAAAGRYVDVAVMAPVHPKRNMAPCLISGDQAAEAAELLAALPMSVRVVAGPVGRASAVKMIRSVMVKGLEALTSECALAAIAAGVADEVLPSLQYGHPRLDVAARATYNFERMMAHGDRRAAEMEEVARTLADLGLPNRMSAATVDWQRDIARAGGGAALHQDDALEAFAELLLPHLRDGQ